jgi:GDSL-like lipase/acylhydrolase family protein
MTPGFVALFSLALTIASASPFSLDQTGTAPRPGSAVPPPSAAVPADRPAPRGDQNSMTAHAQLLEKAKQGRIDVYFVGDSIVRRWGALDYPELLANWTQNFYGWNAGNFGWGADRTQNILWRLENGELDGVNPKVIVVLAGTNNVGAQPRTDSEIAEIAGGVKAIVDACRRKAPGAAIVLTAIFPRNDNMAAMPAIDGIHGQLAAYADGGPGSLPRYQRPAGRCERDCRRRRAQRARQAAPDVEGVSDLGRRVEADLPRAARSSGGHRSRAAAHGGSERGQA